MSKNFYKRYIFDKGSFKEKVLNVVFDSKDCAQSYVRQRFVQKHYFCSNIFFKKVCTKTEF